MPTLTNQDHYQSIGRTFRPRGTDKAIAFLSDIMAATTGTASGTDALTLLLSKLDTDDLLDVRTNLLQASATTKWFVWRSDENRLYVKTYDGTTYGYTPAFSPGDYQLRIIYHTGANANSIGAGISWNAANQTFNVTSGGWALTDGNAAWMRIVVLPASSNAASVSPAIRVGDPPASAVSYTRPNANGLFPSSVGDAKEAFDYIHENVRSGAATSGGGASLIQTFEVTNPSGTLGGVGSQVEGTFTLDSALHNFELQYDGTVFIEANVRLETQASGGVQPGRMGVRVEILNSAGSALVGVPAIIGRGTIQASNRVVNQTIRVAGNLPTNFAGGRWRATVESNVGTPPAIGWVNRLRVELRPDLNSDEVILTRDDLGNNFPDSTELVTLDDALQEADAWPIQPSDTDDLEWPGGQNGIDDNGMWILRQIPLARLLMLRNERPLHTFIGRIRYTSAYITGSAQPGSPDEVDFEHRVWSNLPDGLTNTQLEARTSTLVTNVISNQTATATTRNAEVTIPSDCTAITVGIRSPTGQNDSRVLITDYDFDIEEGIDSSGFDGNLTTNVRSIQSFAQEVDDLTISGSGATTAAGLTVNNAQFYDPANFIGGLREPLPTGLSQPGLVASPTNAQEAFVKTDYMLSLAYNPYQWTQNLDHLPGGVLSEDFRVVANGNVVSSDINVPELYRDISEDLIVRVRVHAQTEPSGFRGRLRIVTSNNHNTNVTGTTPTSINGSLSSQAQGQDIVTQQRIPAASVPSTFAIRLEGTATNTETATFNQGHVYIEVASGDESMGQMGQAVSWNEVIIWTAGLTTTARLTNSNTQTLLAGNTWGQYHWLRFNFDNGTNDGQLFPMVVLASQFRASANYGTFQFSDLYGYNVQPTGSGDNQFRFIWNGAGTKGLRRIIGASIS